MPVGKPLHLRLFLEGEEVPVVSAQVSINTSAPATAAIQVIPLDSGMDLMPRTMVHLFFLDTRVDTALGPRLEGQSNLSGTYRLLFSGELVSFAYSQTPASRGLVLQCMDFSNYWDSCNVMAISYGPGGNAFTNQGSVNGALSGLFDDIPGGSAAEKLVDWLKAKPVTEGLKNISGLAGGVIHIMEAMSGVPGHFKGVNDFYTIAELRCRLLNQITAEENDSTAARVLDQNVFHEWLKNGIEQVGGNVSFRDVMKLLFNYIYYEFVPNPAAKFDEGITPKSSSHKISLNQLPAISTASAEIESINNSLLYPEGFTLSSAQLNLDTASAVTRLSAVIKSLNKVGKATAKSVKILTDVKNQLGKIRIIDTAPTINSAGILTDLSKLDKLRNRLLDAKVLLGGDEKVPQTTQGASSAQRLRTQIIRPDCWFSSPPACNVIFPETYAQISYDRNYLQETTRLLVSEFDTLIGRDQLMAHHSLAPFIGFDATKLARFKGSKSFRILMDHEIHVGIIPKYEWIPNTAGVHQTLDSEQLKKVTDGRLSWLIKASLFHFFKYRFAARQVSVAGRFNPFLVCGFPGAVITRPYIISGGATTLQKVHGTPNQPVPSSEINDLISSKADELFAPSHFVGMVGAVQHSIDQSGGTTSVVLHHARKHRGVDDEFVGVMVKTNETSSKRVIRVDISLKDAEALASGQTPNIKPINLLLGVTPQSEESPKTNKKLKASERPAKLKAVTSTTTVQKASVNPNAPSTQSSFESTQATEADSNSAQNAGEKAPPRTTKQTVPGAGHDGYVPMGSTAIKVNDKKGLYGGKIVGIEVAKDADVLPVSFNVTSQVQQYKETGAAGHQVVASTKTVKSTKRGVAFSHVSIYEEVTVPVSGTLPIEEVLRPSWFSTAYANQNISKKIYQPFFGCEAVVAGISAQGTSTQSADAGPDSEPVDATTSAKDLMTRLQAEESSKRAISVEKALNILGYEYGQVKTQGMDVDTFIRDYTDRPIATLNDIFGDSDLTFTIVDSAVGGDVKAKEVTAKDGSKRTPRVGFHTGAVHPDLATKGKLVGLTTDLQLGFKRVNGVGKEEPLVQSYDVRPKKKLQVMAYIAELTRGPGFRGG